jgi:hypothetical protein
VTHDGAYHDEFHFAHGDDHVHLSCTSLPPLSVTSSA